MPETVLTFIELLPKAKKDTKLMLIFAPKKRLNPVPNDTETIRSKSRGSGMKFFKVFAFALLVLMIGFGSPAWAATDQSDFLSGSTVYLPYSGAIPVSSGKFECLRIDSTSGVLALNLQTYNLGINSVSGDAISLKIKSVFARALLLTSGRYWIGGKPLAHNVYGFQKYVDVILPSGTAVAVAAVKGQSE